MTGNHQGQLREEEINRLSALYRLHGDTTARDALVAHLTPLVESVARQYARYGEPVEDLVQEGFIGLVKALDMYDPQRGVRFVTYSTHLIQGEIRHYLRDRTGVIREPGWLRELNHKVSRAVEHLLQKEGRPPSSHEVAEYLGISESQVRDVMRSRGTFRVVSLDTPTSGNAGGSAAELDKLGLKRLDVLSGDFPLEDRIVLDGAIDALKRIEREVVEAFFFRDLSQTEIARRLGISTNYVSHLIRSALAKLRAALVRQEHSEASMRVRAGLARRRAHLERLPDCADSDPVTGLPTSRHLKIALDSAVCRAFTYGHELGFALLEVDGLARLASMRSSLKAEQAVKDVADVLTANLRRADVVARCDQTRFGVILPQTAETSERVIQRVLRRIQRERIGAPSGKSRGVSLRAGVAVFPIDGLSADELFQAAKEALSRSDRNEGATVRALPLDLSMQAVALDQHAV